MVTWFDDVCNMESNWHQQYQQHQLHQLSLSSSQHDWMTRMRNRQHTVTVIKEAAEDRSWRVRCGAERMLFYWGRVGFQYNMWKKSVGRLRNSEIQRSQTWLRSSLVWSAVRFHWNNASYRRKRGAFWLFPGSNHLWVETRWRWMMEIYSTKDTWWSEHQRQDFTIKNDGETSSMCSVEESETWFLRNRRANWASMSSFQKLRVTGDGWNHNGIL